MDKKKRRLNLGGAVSVLVNTGTMFLLFFEIFAFESYRKVTGGNSLTFKIILGITVSLMLASYIASLCIYKKMKKRLNQADEMTEKLIHKAGYRAFIVVSAFITFALCAVLLTVMVLSFSNSNIRIAEILDFRYMLLLICVAGTTGNLTFFISAFRFDKKGIS